MCSVGCMDFKNMLSLEFFKKHCHSLGRHSEERMRRQNPENYGKTGS